MVTILPGPGNQGSKPIGPDDDPLATLPEGPFKLTADVLQGMSEQQEQVVREEWVHRQAFCKLGFHCKEQEQHNWTDCTQCNGLGRRISKDGVYFPCIVCSGKGSTFSMSIMTWGCRHVYPQDEVHPAGLIFTPKRYYVCKTCWKLIERKKFKFGTELGQRCWHCINEESHRLHKINPELVVDLTKK